MHVTLSTDEIRKFRKAIYTYYKEHGRELPWRRTQDPYRILVSEMMLQQTQVDRVLEKYPAFVRQFPNFAALADAYLRDVLAAWQGLGYNRRAVSLKKIGEIVAKKHSGRLHADVDFLTGLPSVGYNTACAILAFAFNKPVVFIETNIRTVFTHFFFSHRNGVRDSEILPLVEQTLVCKDPHSFYSALMDYGTMLKKTHGSINPKSAHYQKQSLFKGSVRQIRGMVLAYLLGNPNSSQSDIAAKVGVTAERLQQTLKNLQTEGFVRESKGVYSIAQ